MKSLLLIILLLLLLPMSSNARQWHEGCEAGNHNSQPITGKKLQAGFAFYCDADEGGEEADKTAPPAAPDQTAKQRMEKMLAELEEARALAVLEPTPANVEHYMFLQKHRMDLASEFAGTWKHVLWQTAELDYNAKYPHNTLGKRVTQQIDAETRQKYLSDISKTHVIIYVGSNSCAYCKTYGPILQQFATNNDLHIFAVSTDHRPLQGFEHSVINEGQLKQIGINTAFVPMTALFETSTKKVTTIGFGVLTHDVLAQRIYQLTAKGAGNGF